MEKDNLKDRIKQDQGSWDIYDFDKQEVWSEIEMRLNKQKRHNFRSYLSIAASVVLLCLAFTSLYMITKDEELPTQVAELEAYYKPMAMEKLQIIQAHKSELDPQIFKDIQMLDSAYLELRNDLKDDIDNEEVIQAMIQNYRAKLQILEHILNEIQENDKTNKSDEIAI